MGRAVFLNILWMLLLSGPSIAGADNYLGGNAQACLMCHGPNSSYPAHDILATAHAFTGNSTSPFAEGQKHCEACHGPSREHLSIQADGSRPLPAVVFDQRNSAADKSAVCLACHQADTGHHWASSAHPFEEVACTDCHQLHPRRDPALVLESRDGICLNCHSRERSDLLRASTHPLHAGLMHCTDCHNPHGSAGPAMLVGLSINETCYQCHAEKRGPFLWEHAPVLEDCTHCHLPHGSNHRDLLVTRTPMLCQQCHLAPFHPSGVMSGSGVPPQGADRNLLGRDCMSCHSRVHGSNHPSGAGLTR